MKNLSKLLLPILFIVVLLLQACGTVTNKIDPNKTQIYISCWNGGYGYDWMQEAAIEFNSTSDEFEVIPLPNKDEKNTIRDNLIAGVTDYDMYYGNLDVREAFALNLIADVSDLWDSKADESEEKTIREKMLNSSQFEEAYSNNGKIYALPGNEGLKGLIYDHSHFVKNLFLFGENNSFITSPTQKLRIGRDGIENTYDDGQPETLQEYYDMCSRIKAKGFYPFTYSRMFDYYPDQIYNLVVASYDGLDNYKLNYTLNGTYTYPSTGATKTITLDEGYVVFNTEGRQKALNFLANTVFKNEYKHPDTTKLGASHTDAQMNFIYGTYKPTSTIPPVGMIVEGDWWENEARSVFNTLAKKGEVDFEYGVRDYRFMTLPIIDEHQKIKDGNALVVSENLIYTIKQTTNADKIRGSKEFIKFMMQEKNHRRYTRISGGLVPYQYTLTNDDLKGMTKFSQNLYQMYTDSKNVMIRPVVDAYHDSYYYGKMVFAATKDNNDTYYARIAKAFDAGMSASTYFNNATSYYQNNWSSIKSAILSN